MIEDNKDLLNDDTSEDADTNEEVTEEYEEGTEEFDTVDNTRIFDGTDVEDEVEYEEEEELAEDELEEDEEPGGNGPKRDMKKILIPVIIAAIIILVVLIFVMLQGGGNKGGDATTTPSTSTTTTPSAETIDFSKYPEIWDANYEINSDYVGEIVFESGIIDQPMVHYSGEGIPNPGYTKYERTDWKTMEYSEEGSVFVDPYVDLANSTNITIYGHYVYESLDPTRTHMFTPLALLIDEENYEDNKYFYIVLENEVRKYEIAYVYYAQLTGDPIQPLANGMNYMLTEWTDDELNYYIDEVEKVQFYDTGVDIEPGDKFVTLQTCVENDDMRREIVVAKEVEVTELR